VRRAEGAPLGPGSLLWRYAADGRSLLTGTAAGLLQLMHPGLGAGVAQHSAFFEDPWGRILRSVPQIWGTIFATDEEGAARGRAIRDLHPDIKGVDHRNRRYHALDPEVFWWAHATFTWEFLRARELFWARPPSPAQRQQLYAETVTWFRRYGVSDRYVPADVGAFDATFDHYCREVLEPTPASIRAVTLAQTGRAPDLVLEGLPWVLRPASPLILRSTGQVLRLMALGSLPASARRRGDIRWSPFDRVQYAALVASIRESSRVVPRSAYRSLVPPGTPVAA